MEITAVTELLAGMPQRAVSIILTDYAEIVTAINTNPQAAVVSPSSSTYNSYFGGKETIVKVTGGKGHEIALSDINFV